MADFETRWDPAIGRGDWTLPAPVFRFATDAAGQPMIGADGFAIRLPAAGASPGDGLAAGHDIETAVLISIFTDAAAGPDDQIPDGTDDPRGWWADPAMGSKLWLLQRAKRTAATLQLAVAYIRQALAWLIEDGAAANVEVDAEWQPDGRLAGRVVVTQPGGPVSVAFAYSWKDL